MTSDNHKKEIDQHSGVETTGHEWDGIKELNNPAPRWWLWVFYLTVIWSVGYWVIYPAWPTLSGEGFRGGTEGILGWTQYEKLKQDQSVIVARKGKYLEDFNKNDFATIMQDPELYAFAVAGGRAAFKENCAQCHGTGGGGGKGYPNLNDDEWIWGGTINAIYTTLQQGIRSGHPESKENYMPAFGKDGILNKAEMEAVAEYVLALSGGNAPAPEEVPEPVETDTLAVGATIYREQCASCHAPKGQGNKELGAPALNDAIWLYGDGSKELIINQLYAPKHGVMPYWSGRLNDETIRQLTVYVHSLGGGEPDPIPEEEKGLGDMLEEMLPEPAITREAPRVPENE